MSKIRVLLVGDHASLDRVLPLLVGFDDIELVGETPTTFDATVRACRLKVHVVLLQVITQPQDAFKLAYAIITECPGCRVLVLSRFEDKEAVLCAMQAGVSGYLFNRTIGAELAQAIRAVAQGGMVLDPAAARIVVQAYLHAEPAPVCDLYESLTDREREILILVAEGYTNQQIADLLHISPKTVDSHRTRLMSKLDLHNGRDVVRYALRQRLIDL